MQITSGDHLFLHPPKRRLPCGSAADCFMGAREVKRVDPEWDLILLEKYLSMVFALAQD
ncbi:hypothetical protein M407DRAFT_241170 [Tulasnella calospora MUT 4182]|uniref:Uncharacterized protein n=1 Tax=Tulasnella calospora MUT 4182 TaxID=1051891 RepID=A0A0C3QKR8_9AGAM|nr:hypothetical protein M407DRAFT_241170 [Tulasnella calospora MUT 4182]